MFLRVTVSLLCRLQAASKIHVPIYPYLISEGRRNCSILIVTGTAEAVTLRKHVTKYKHMNKWMVENLRNRGIEIARINLICITNLID